MVMTVEALLRPKIELQSACVAGGGAAMCMLAQDYLLMTPTIAYSSAVLLGSLGVYRTYQAYNVYLYQKNLKRLPKYELKADDVPQFTHHTFLGKGFKYTQKHTQRVIDAMRPEVANYLEPSSMTKFIRELEQKYSGKPGWDSLFLLTKTDSALNPFRPLPAVGGNPLLHAVETEEKDVTIPHVDRNQHIAVFGQTRVGKTRLAELLLIQDIRMSNKAGKGGMTVFLDPKGDAQIMARMYTEAKKMGREDDFIFMHLGFPHLSARYNAVGNFSRITEIATRIADQLPSEGNSSAFREFSWRFVNVVAQALYALGKRPDYSSIMRYVTNVEPLFVKYSEVQLPKILGENAQATLQLYQDRAEKMHKSNSRAVRCASSYAEGIRLCLEDEEIDDPVLEGLLSSLRYERSFYEKLVASLLPFLQKLVTGKVSELLVPEYFDVDDPRPIFDWESAIRRKAIVYIGLDAMASRDTSFAIGNAMLSDLLNVSARIYRTGIEDGMLGGKMDVKPEIFVHADEFNELAGDESIALSNKAAGSGVRLTVYTQSRDDSVAKMQDIAKSKQLESNFGSLIMFRVKSKNTAELLTDQLPEVDVSQRMTISGANDNSDVTTTVDFTSSTQDRVTTQRVTLIQPSDLTSLPKGQAFCLLNGGELWKVRFPLPVDEPDMPKGFEVVAEQMRSNYFTAESWWEE